MYYFQPESLKDLLLIIDNENNCEIIAGGTDLIINLAGLQERSRSLVDITNIKEIKGVRKEKSGIVIGAATTISNVARAFIPDCLIQGARSIGSPQIRNAGTIGGNICNASPCGDTLAPLICLNADFILTSSTGERTVSAENFFLGPKQTILRPKEFLKEIRIGNTYLEGKSAFRMIGQRNGQAISQVNLAVWLKRDDKSAVIRDIRIAAGSVAPTPLRFPEAEDELRGINPDKAKILQVAKLIKTSIKPINDVRSTAEYRHDVISGMFEELTRELLDLKGA
jgi:CO/xanthine dehydrogenase FAD-binding subunit